MEALVRRESTCIGAARSERGTRLGGTMVATVKRRARIRRDSPSGHIHIRFLHCTRGNAYTRFLRNRIYARTNIPVEASDYGS
jgi:hypothetical protein